MRQFREASVHGRFQPLHKGHLEYIVSAKELCDFLWIGVTQFDVSALLSSPRDAHREDPLNNPLSYFERVDMVAEVMAEAGFSRNEYGIMPFPVDQPSSLSNYLPTTIPILTTIYESWNDYKVALLRDLGYEVLVLWRRDFKAYEGLEVRNRIRLGDASWEGLVPSATVRVIKKYGISERLQRLAGHNI